MALWVRDFCNSTLARIELPYRSFDGTKLRVETYYANKRGGCYHRCLPKWGSFGSRRCPPVTNRARPRLI